MSGSEDRLPADTDVVLMLDSLDSLGGVQRVVSQVADGLADRGTRVAVVALRRDDEPHPVPIRNPVPRIVVTGHTVSMPYSPVPWSRRARLLARRRGDAVRHFDAGVRRLRSLLAGTEDPVVIAMQVQSAEWAVAAGVPPTRLVVQWHGSFECAIEGKELTRLAYVSRRASRTLALNVGDAARLTSAGVGPVGWIRNPVDLSSLPPGPPVADRAPVVVAAGRHVVDKGYDVLIRAWAQVAGDHPAWRLRIHGDGPERNALTALARELGVDRVIDLAAPVADLPAVLRGAAIHVLPSRHEGMGLVLAEAMASATPSIATACGAGVRELAGEGAGLLVPVDDVAALATALRDLIGDPPLRATLAETGRRRIQGFTMERAIDAWTELVADIRAGCQEGSGRPV